MPAGRHLGAHLLLERALGDRRGPVLHGLGRRLAHRELHTAVPFFFHEARTNFLSFLPCIRAAPFDRAGMADLLALVKQQSEQLGALVDTERRRREEEERAARASAKALEQKEIAAARAANPPPTMPPILARRPSCGESSSRKTDDLSLAVMQSQNRQLREAVLTANQRNAARKKELEKERTASARKLAPPPPVPPPRRARSAAPRLPAAAYQYELRKLRAEFAVAQQDSVVLQAQQAILQQALHKAAETRQAYAEMRDRKSESERRAHTPSAASAPRRRRRRPEVGA